MKKKNLLKKIIVLVVITLVIIAIKQLIPKSKAEEITTLEVTYKVGDGIGKDITFTQEITNEQQVGENDYTNRKIVLYDNTKINFEGGTTEYDGQTYQKILTGWKLTSITQDGEKITEFIQPENEDYANTQNASKDINTVYAQNGWYIVPENVTEIEVIALYGRAIYIRSPYDKMYYDEYHIFYYGENSDGLTSLPPASEDIEQAHAKSSDANYGTNENDAVSTLKRAYELIEDDSTATIYDTAFVLCGDLYEINYNLEGVSYITDNEETYQNYTSNNLGYNTVATKPVTITGEYNLYLTAPEEAFDIYSSLRFDNITLKTLPIENIRDIHGNDVTINTYTCNTGLSFYTTGEFEVTETVENEEIEIMYGNLSSIKLNSGTWKPSVAKTNTITSLAEGNYIKIGGLAQISKLALGFEEVTNVDTILANPPTIVITGGKISNIYGTGLLEDATNSIKGNVNIFVSGGKISNIYGTGTGNIYASNEELGNVNVKIYDGTICGIYANYQNGTITGNSILTFENFQTTYIGARYKEIGAIDYWKNVIFDNSYVLLKNKNNDGETQAITQVVNLSVPENSGLKLSIDAEITGNFTGGGNLYLDSGICLTIGGDISGVTTVTLNPVLLDGSNVIKGGISHPYLRVSGSNSVATVSIDETIEQISPDVISSDSNYEILATTQDATYYYIDADVEISNYVEINATNAVGKIYKGDLTDTNDIDILEIGNFTSNLEINYEFYKDSENPDKYKNITRELTFKKTKNELVQIPKGTEILMIYENENYSYVVNEEVTSINLSLFKNEEGELFSQITNLQNAEGIQKQNNEVTVATLYNYSENYRFIVSFSNIDKNIHVIEAGSYYLMLNINDDGSWIEDEQLESANKVNISQILVNSTVITDKSKYEANDIINITSSGTIELSSTKNKQLYGNIKLYNNSNQQIEIPEGAIIKLNNTEIEVIKGTAQVEVLQNIQNSTETYNFELSMDMSEVLKQNQLIAGDYNIVIEYVFAQNDILEGKIAGWLEIPITIIEYNDFGIKAEIQNDGSFAVDKLQLIIKEDEETRNVKLTYDGELEEPKVKVSVLEKTGDFEYSVSENSKKIQINNSVLDEGSLETNLLDSLIFNIKFDKTMGEGTYRVKFDIYDKYGTKKTEDFVNFIVIENLE